MGFFGVSRHPDTNASKKKICRPRTETGPEFAHARRCHCAQNTSDQCALTLRSVADGTMPKQAGEGNTESSTELLCMSALRRDCHRHTIADTLYIHSEHERRLPNPPACHIYARKNGHPNDNMPQTHIVQCGMQREMEGTDASPRTDNRFHSHHCTRRGTWVRSRDSAEFGRNTLPVCFCLWEQYRTPTSAYNNPPLSPPRCGHAFLCACDCQLWPLKGKWRGDGLPLPNQKC